jgi:hypothetical protein
MRDTVTHTLTLIESSHFQMLYPAPIAALAALAALPSLSAASPNGFGSYKSAPDGPTKLDDCGCWPIYQKMLTCQKLKGSGKEIAGCVCIPNPDGWYTSMNGCRACLSPGSYELNDFFDNMSRTITQLFVSCTEVGGGILSDGESICASNAYFRACTSLKTGGLPSWASYVYFADGKGGKEIDGNGTYVLDIAEYQAGASTTDTATSTSTTSSSATTTQDSTTDSGTSVTTGTSAPTAARTSGITTTATLASSGPSTTASSSAPGSAGSRSQAGRIMGLVVAVGVGAVLF